jgi:DNA-binding IclR family transcriptional regulator
VKTVAKALRVLKYFTPEHEEWGVSEIARASGINKVIVHRILRTFAADRFVAQDARTRRYRLGEGLIEMARRNLQPLDIGDIARPELERLRDATNETVMLVVRRGMATVVAEPFESRQTVRVTAQVGDWAELYCSATGKLFLTYGPAWLLDELLKTRLKRHTPNTLTRAPELRKALLLIRQRGWAADDEEAVPGIRAVAAPILRADGSVVACIAVRAPAVRLPRSTMPQLAARAVETAKGISAEVQKRDEVRSHQVP